MPTCLHAYILSPEYAIRLTNMRIHHAQLSVKTASRVSIENVTAMVRLELEQV